MNSSDHQRRPLHLIPCFGSKYKFTNAWNIENHGLMQKKEILKHESNRYLLSQPQKLATLPQTNTST